MPPTTSRIERAKEPLSVFLKAGNVPTSRYCIQKVGIMSKGEKTRARVLEAARQLINQKGFRSTSVNDIIKVTGVKKGNLYFHFASKEELGLAILRQAHEDFMAFLGNSLKGDRPLERVSSLLDAVFEKQRNTKFVGG